MRTLLPEIRNPYSFTVFQLWWAVCGFKLHELPGNLAERAHQLELELDGLINEYCKLTCQTRPTFDELYGQADLPGSKFDDFSDMPAAYVLDRFWATYFDKVKYIASDELLAQAQDVQVRSYALFA